MANSDKNILITPNIGNTAEPKIVFTGGNNNPTTLRVLDDGTLSFEGGVGQLFSIANNLVGQIFAVNDISGIPSIEAYSNGLVTAARYNGRVTIGTVTAANVKFGIGANDAVLLPVGNTSQRPSAAMGLFRFNSETNSFEGANTTAWGPVGGATAGQNTWVQFNSSNTLGASANLTFNSATSVLDVTGNVVVRNAVALGNTTNATAVSLQWNSSTSSLDFVFG